MIGQLRGTIISKQPPLLILDVHGVGYEVHAPMSTFYQLPDLQQEAMLLIHFVVREDAQLLYGFHSSRERDLFRALIKVNGVGPKLALTILSGIEVDSFVQCVQNNDHSRLTCIPGIGKKTAERLLIETRDVLSQWTAQTAINELSQQSVVRNPAQDAISALTTLGYKPAEAKRAINLIQQPDLSSEALIRLALQHIAQGNS